MSWLKSAGKSLLKKAVKKFLLWLAGIFGVPLLVFLLILMFVLSIYGVVAAGDLNYSFSVNGADDRRIEKGYQEAVAPLNRFAAVDEPDMETDPPISADQSETKYYLDWQILYAIDLFEAQLKREEFTVRGDERAEVLRPRFRYRDSTIVTVCTDEEGHSHTTVTPVKLLVEADTYKGLFRQHYVRVTSSGGSCTTTYDRLDKIEEVDPYGRLDEALKEWLDQDVEEMDRQLILQGAAGVKKKSPYFEWLLGKEELLGFLHDGLLAEIPPDYLQWFKEAGEQYGIDWAVLAAVAKIESGFDPGVVGPENHTGELAKGMMQFLPSTWARFGVDADGDGEANPHNAKDSIFSAARYLAFEKQSKGSLDKAIFAYNHSNEYVRKVKDLAASYRWQAAHGQGRYVFPVQGPWEITDIFGRYRPKYGSNHHGLDIGAAGGTPVVAAYDGRVLHTIRNPEHVYGNHIWLQSYDMNTHIYAHLRSIEVREGEEVRAGQVIGRVGSTGNSDGNHLHFEVRYMGGWKDPAELIFGYKVPRGLKGGG